MKPDISTGTTGWPPEQTIFPIARMELPVTDREHPLLAANADAIRDNWQREIAANPHLYDGRMIFQRHLSISGDAIVGEGHVIPFSAFMWWRRQADRAGGFHLFAYPVLETSDGALVAIRMGQYTANPGQVYFAAGSLDEADIVDGHCDLDLNMRREVMEETGLDLGDAVAGSGYLASHYRRALTVSRLFRFEMTAEEMIAAIERHMLVAEDKEIAGAVAIRSADRSAHPYNVSMLPIMDWYFGQVR